MPEWLTAVLVGFTTYFTYQACMWFIKREKKKRPSQLKMIDAWVEDLRRDESILIEISKNSENQISLKFVDPNQIFLRSPGKR